MTDPLDPMVAGSLASKVATTPLQGNVSLPPNPIVFNRQNPPWNTCDAADSDTQCYLKITIGMATA